MERNMVRSPEGLDSYIAIASPGTIVMLAAITLALVSLVVWGFTDMLPMMVSYQGYVYRSDYFASEHGDSRKKA